MAWISTFYLNPEGSDVRVVFQEDDKELKLPAHSFVLRSRSKVFKTLLEKDRTREGKTRVVTLKGVRMTIAKHFLQFLYQGVLTDRQESHLVDLIVAGNIYDIADLVSQCDSALQPRLYINNACEVYQTLSQMHVNVPHESLEKCRYFMNVGAEIIFHRDDHFILGEQQLSMYLSDDGLNISSENVAFDALWRWGRHQCGLDSLELCETNIFRKIEPLFLFIRWKFLHMKTGFAQELLKNNRLPPGEPCGERKGVRFPPTSSDYCGTIALAGSPLRLKCEHFNKNVSTETYDVKNMLSISVSHKIYLMAFKVSLLCPNELLGKINDITFKVTGVNECMNSASSNFILINGNVLFEVTVTLDTPLLLVPGFFTMVEYYGELPLTFTSADFDMRQKSLGPTSFILSQLKDMACELILYQL